MALTAPFARVFFPCHWWGVVMASSRSLVGCGYGEFPRQNIIVEKNELKILGDVANCMCCSCESSRQARSNRPVSSCESSRQDSVLLSLASSQLLDLALKALKGAL
eukprot:g26591.t1